MGLAACVLLIACANLANLQLARNVGRARDFALHAALGASRLRVIRQSLVESVLLGLAGGGLGLLVAAWTTDALGSRVEIAGQMGLAMPLDRRVLAFTAGASVLTGVLFGILPAWLASRGDVNETLKQGGRGSTSGPTIACATASSSPRWPSRSSCCRPPASSSAASIGSRCAITGGARSSC